MAGWLYYLYFRSKGMLSDTAWVCANLLFRSHIHVKNVGPYVPTSWVEGSGDENLTSD